MTGFINSLFRPQKTLKKTEMKLYNTPCLPAVLYNTENGTIKARDAGRKTAAEMQYMTETAG